MRMDRSRRFFSRSAKAEGAGFEPAVRVNGLRFSRPVHSTALPPLREAERRLLRVRPHADRAGHAGPAEPAIAAGVLRQVLLVVVLGVEERRGVIELGRDLAEAALGELGPEAHLRRLRGGPLLRRRRVDGGAVLRAGVVPLAHALGRVVALPEGAEQVVVRGLVGVVGDEDGLGVSGAPGAHLVVRGVGREPALVADGGRVDAGELPEHALGAPEASEPEVRDLGALGERRPQRGAQHLVARRHRDLRLAAGQRLVGGRHGGLVTAEEKHLLLSISRARDHYDAVRARPRAVLTGWPNLYTGATHGEVAEWLKALAC